MAKYFFLLIIIGIQLSLFSQKKPEAANQKVTMAIDLMDNGNPDEAIIMLDEAKKNDPKNYIYDYEKAFAYYIKKDYRKALKLYKEVLKYDSITDQCYQMLGNLYDVNGKPEKALDAYDNGLKRFPGSGRLYLEKGNVYWNQRKLSMALPYYEKGIEVDPTFSSNYYRAAILYCNSTEEVWGMIYGEIFVNLERNSPRTKEISKLLFDTYKSQIVFSSDTSVRVSFCKNTTITIDDFKDTTKFKIPFGVGVYEPNLLLSVYNEKVIDLNSINRIRNRFITRYFENNYKEEYPNVLFSYNKKVLDAQQFEAYNYWLLMAGDEATFNSWKYNNSEKWESFVSWFIDNAIEINDTNKFVRNK